MRRSLPVSSGLNRSTKLFIRSSSVLAWNGLGAVNVTLHITALWLAVEQEVSLCLTLTSSPPLSSVSLIFFLSLNSSFSPSPGSNGAANCSGCSVVRNAGVSVQSHSLCLISKRWNLNFPLLPSVSILIIWWVLGVIFIYLYPPHTEKKLSLEIWSAAKCCKLVFYIYI